MTFRNTYTYTSSLFIDCDDDRFVPLLTLRGIYVRVDLLSQTFINSNKISCIHRGSFRTILSVDVVRVSRVNEVLPRGVKRFILFSFDVTYVYNFYESLRED